MLFSKKQSIEDILVEIVAATPYISGMDLLTAVQRLRPKTTKQAVYTALQSLIANEVFSKVGGKYFLSRIWVTRLATLTNIQPTIARDSIFDLRAGESITYHFPNLLTCDTYWAHLFDILIAQLPTNKPITVWMPHQWFVIARKTAEQNLIHHITQKKLFAFYNIKHHDPLDQTYKKTWSTDTIRINTKSSAMFDDTYHVHIFDSIIIEVHIPDDLAQKITAFYANHTDERHASILETLITEKAKIRMKVSNSPTKAASLRKKILKDFFVPKELEV